MRLGFDIHYDIQIEHVDDKWLTWVEYYGREIEDEMFKQVLDELTIKFAQLLTELIKTWWCLYQTREGGGEND